MGRAKITRGYKLKARSVIHAVGPVYGNAGAPELLASAYTSSLELAIEHAIRSIAFPAISTGAYGYPLREAALIALSTVVAFARTHTEIERVEFILFTRPALEIFQETLARLIQDNDDLRGL